jgi:predicted PurR-regulated permease PerM
MNEPQIVKTEGQVLSDSLKVGIVGLILVSAVVAAVYIKYENAATVIVAGILTFISSCFVKPFREGYIAIISTAIALIIILMSIGLIAFAIGTFYTNS